jgi:hypothetical protein
LGEEDVLVLKSENTLLRDTIRQLEEENQRLKQRANKIVLENFEGENWFKEDSKSASMGGVGITLTGEEIGQEELWCDELDGGEQIASLIEKRIKTKIRNRRNLFSQWNFTFRPMPCGADRFFWRSPS